MERLLLYSIENREKIVIFYMDRDNNVTQRFIRVIDISPGSVLAYCYYRKEVRSFRLDNILSFGPVKRRVGA
ncbi:hypothetical protein [Oceanobacillus saliphilus]|uniref:hypothetical protein n=1 Tax=Oceanobacillus saliphilus TaxID=2925834 RepID=UPI00201D3080|nr:hypothetical protein [Oceanobacillus saliphilus]